MSVFRKLSSMHFGSWIQTFQRKPEEKFPAKCTLSEVDTPSELIQTVQRTIFQSIGMSCSHTPLSKLGWKHQSTQLFVLISLSTAGRNSNDYKELWIPFRSLPKFWRRKEVSKLVRWNCSLVNVPVESKENIMDILMKPVPTETLEHL